MGGWREGRRERGSKVVEEGRKEGGKGRAKKVKREGKVSLRFRTI